MNFLSVFTNFLLLVTFCLCQTIDTDWTDSVSGTYFNYAGLRRPSSSPWTVKKDSGVFSEIYRFNFGDVVDFLCHNKLSSATEHLEVFQKPSSTCSHIGDAKQRRAELINPLRPSDGIIIDYMNGEMCAKNFNSLEKAYKSPGFIYSVMLIKKIM